MSKLVLASASPRRREILEQLGIAHEVRASDVDEARIEGQSGPAHAERLAQLKAGAIAALLLRAQAHEAHGSSPTPPARTVLAADTVVLIDGEVLEKPESDAAARGMLRMLAGRRHEVTTAIALARGEALLESLRVTTRVSFRPLDVATIERYVATGEGRDKAGAYGVQGIAAGFVTSIEGSYTNVVGLPAAETLALLEKHGVLREWPLPRRAP